MPSKKNGSARPNKSRKMLLQNLRKKLTEKEQEVKGKRTLPPSVIERESKTRGRPHLPDSLDAPKLDRKQRKFLHKLYFTEKNFFGRDKLWRLARERRPDLKISRRQTLRFLAENELTQLFQQKKKEKDIVPTVQTTPLKVLMVDLKNMETYEHKGYKYILICVDTFSKYIWTRPLKERDAQTTAKAMASILDNIQKEFDTKPTVIRSDQGSEFKDQFKKLLDARGVKLVFNKKGGEPQATGQAERSVGIISRLVRMQLAHSNDADWIKPLEKLTKNYNSVWQRVIKMSPNDAIKGGNQDVEVEKNIKKAQSAQGCPAVPCGMERIPEAI